MTADRPESARCRVTVDIDSYAPQWQLTAIRAYYNARAAGAVHIDVRISSSGHGIHLIAWFPTLLSTDQKQRLRATLGDDPNRLDMDRVRDRVNHTTQVLWTQKGPNQIETHPEDVWHALETIECRQRAITESIPHGFANQGRKAVGRLAFPHKTPEPDSNE